MYKGQKIYCASCGNDVGTLDCRYDCECGCTSFMAKPYFPTSYKKVD